MVPEQTISRRVQAHPAERFFISRGGLIGTGLGTILIKVKNQGGRGTGVRSLLFDDALISSAYRCKLRKPA